MSFSEKQLPRKMGDLLSSVSLLLAFVTLFLGYMYPSIQRALDRKPPDEARIRERVQFRVEIRRVIFTNVLPVLIMFAALFYVCLPKTVAIIRSSSFAFWDFDYISTIFVLVEVAIGAFLGHVAIVFIRLISLRNDAK